MTCPFLDPSMLARLPAEKREEMKETYHRMKQEQSDHLKIDIKEDEIENVTTEQLLMGMTGTSGSTNGGAVCPVLGPQPISSSGGSQGETPMDMQEQFENDPQAFMQRMAEMSSGGGSCPFMGSKYFDPFNEKFEFGWNCNFKSRWGFILNNKGRMTTRRFLSERKIMQKVPIPLQHTLFHPDDLKKLRDKPFSGLFFHFDKYKDEANKLYKEGEYFEGLEYYEQILSVFKWMEFTDKERNEDFFKALKLEPILDKDIKVCEKDLQDDECEIEMRKNLVVTLLMSIGYCFMKMFYYDEALQCFDYAIDLAPEACDVYIRRSQVRMYNKESTMEDLKKAVDDANRALEKRPKDKFYNQHKQDLELAIKNHISGRIMFIQKLVEKAEAQFMLKMKLKLKRQRMIEETKGKTVDAEGEKENDSDEEVPNLTYPEECRVLDIMKTKYYDAIQFFNDTNDKKQVALAVKEYQRFSFFYEKMSKYLEFDPSEIEDDIYQRLPERTKQSLSDPKILKEINVIRHNKAQRILEDEDVNVLNFQMFQYALKLFQKEKKAKLKAEEEKKKSEEEKNGGQKKSQTGSMTKLILVNIIFFLVVASGIMFVSGHSPFELMGMAFMHAKKKDDGL